MIRIKVPAPALIHKLSPEAVTYCFRFFVNENKPEYFRAAAEKNVDLSEKK